MLILFFQYVQSCMTISNEKIVEINENITCLNVYNIKSLILLDKVNNFILNLYDSYQMNIKSTNEIVIDLSIKNSSILYSYNVSFISEYGFDFQQSLNSYNIITDNYNYCHFYYNNSCLYCDKTLENGKCYYSSPMNCYRYKNKCLECLEGYYLENYECKKCNINCRRCTKDKCILCKNGYIGENCTLNNDYIQDKLYNCYQSSSNGSYCIHLDNCLYSNLNHCNLCNNSLLFNYECINHEGIEKSSNNSLLCKDGYFNLNDSCISCSYYGDCNLCNNKTCINCNKGILDLNGYCKNYTCENYQYFNGYQCENKTKDYQIENCLDQKQNICYRCINGFYLYNNKCIKCQMNCIMCNSSQCIKCNNQTYLENGLCKNLTDEIKDKCYKTIPGNSNQCAICKDGYYNLNGNCYNCPINCTKCNSIECFDCIKENFLNENLSCSSYDLLQNCIVKTINGCKKCEDGYYLDRYCYECTPNCNNCDIDNCYNCTQDYILINNECIHYSNIKHCLSASNGKCIKCSFFYKDDYCNFYIPFYIIIVIVIFVILIIIFFSFILLSIALFMIKRFYSNEMDDDVTLFNMKYSNIYFRENDHIKYSFDTLDYGNNVKVDKISKHLLCIGNKNNKNIKVQMTFIKNNKYELEIKPEVVIIKKNYACEFSVYLKPLCSCVINDKIKLLVLLGNKQFTYDFNLVFVTELSSKLDYDDLIIKEKLGEGSFGIVYKGYFKLNSVAIKKLKGIKTKRILDEFNNEVTMLDKFKSNYIIYFYGSIILPNDLYIVTEFAPLGSLQKLINEHYEMDENIKIKIIDDCARGIEYLHNNGILHRDIKPDNFLLFNITNLDKTIINCKLTDFGSSRNINLLMTNITFTKGIGTPKYMSPEILNKEHYKKPSDIYSFAITIYEFFTMTNAYPKSKFKYEWNIATFVTEGKRLSLDCISNETIKDIIQNSWKHDKLSRYKINDIIKKLENN